MKNKKERKKLLLAHIEHYEISIELLTRILNSLDINKKIKLDKINLLKLAVKLREEKCNILIEKSKLE